jgi:hypothetical protein
LCEEFKKELFWNNFMVSCNICGQKIQELFLEKIKGSYIKKPGNSKLYAVCFSCQKKLPGKEELLKHLK